MGEPGVWGEVTAGLKVSRPVLVAWLLELDAAGAPATAHVRVAARPERALTRTARMSVGHGRLYGVRVEPCPVRRGDRGWSAATKAGPHDQEQQRGGHEGEDGGAVHELGGHGQLLVGVAGKSGEGRAVEGQ